MVSPGEDHIAPMNAMSDISTASYYVTVLENAEARRLGRRIEQARPSVARRVGVVPGTLRNIRKLRTKVVPHWLMARIRAAFVAELQAEIGRLQHEINIHFQTGSDPRSDDLAKAKAQVEAAQALINGRGE